MGKPQISIVHDVLRQTEAARQLLSQYGDILGDDAQAKADAVEGETDLNESLTQALARVVEIDGLEAGVESIIANAKKRLDRLQKQRELLRTAIATALEVAGVDKFETPVATVALKRVPPKVEIVDEMLIPSGFWKPQDPKLDKQAIARALKDKVEVPGAVLGNGGLTIQIGKS